MMSLHDSVNLSKVLDNLSHTGDVKQNSAK